MINVVGCSENNSEETNIHDKIHSLYYNIKSYSAECKITLYTKAGSNTYDCMVKYDSDSNVYMVNSDDMSIVLSDQKCIISHGENTIESPPSQTDMYIFVNTFFKSYYECEDTAINVAAKPNSDSVLLECSIINPSPYATQMKLWINKKTVKPEKMQVFDSDNAVIAEIGFKNFDFAN